MSQEEKVPITVSLSKELSKKIEDRMKRLGFSSIQAYITYVLEQVAAEQEQEVYTKEEEEKIKDRLRAMGYL